MTFPILFEDDAFLVINKPPGVVVNRAQSVKEQTVQDWMDGRFQFARPADVAPTPDDFWWRSGIVHRIDKETSGILVLAKTPHAFVELQRQFKERLIQKTYLAIAHGKIVPEVGEINAPVGRLPWNKEQFGIVPGGKESVTKYSVHRTWERVHRKTKEDITLVELHPETGRTHQIRVHLKYIHHPIVGDYLYAGRKTSRDDREWAPRVMLHAWKMVLFHPVTGDRLAFEAPIPDDMNVIIKS